MALSIYPGPMTAEAKGTSPHSVPFIDNLVQPKPAPGWDDVIKPQLVRAAEQAEQARLKAIEDAKIAAEKAEADRIEAERIEAARVARLPKSFGTYANAYSFGNCTWYVASRKSVPSFWGNARTWYYNAASQGWAVGSTPQVGAVAQTTVGWAGHVALVEAVNGTQVLVSEMNYLGFNVVDQRWTNASDWNYIY